MDLMDYAAAVFIGNVMTLSVVAAYRQFEKHDYKAPWLAYAGVVLPAVLVLLAG